VPGAPKEFAIQVQQVVIGVKEVRAKANSIQLTPELVTTRPRSPNSTRRRVS
jgi:hypothetical protein